MHKKENIHNIGWFIFFKKISLKIKILSHIFPSPEPQIHNNFPSVRLLCLQRNSKWMNLSLWPVHFRPWISQPFPWRGQEKEIERMREKTERQIEMFCVITRVHRTTAHI